jgi:hypothetical protein
MGLFSERNRQPEGNILDTKRASEIPAQGDSPVKSLVKKLIIAMMLMLSAPVAFASDVSKNIDPSETAKRQAERERQFLFRSVEDLNRSQQYVQAAIRALEKQIAAVDFLDTANRQQDLASLLEWYRSYAELLSASQAGVEADLANAYSDDPEQSVQPERYRSLAEGYSRLAGQLEDLLTLLDKLFKTTQVRIDELKSVLLYITSAEFNDERQREKKPSPQGNDRGADRVRPRSNNEMYERYREITDLQIAIMAQDLKTLEEMQLHFLVVFETSRLEQSWIMRKTGDYSALAQLASAVSRGAPPLIEDASSRMIQRYDADIAYFKRKSEEISKERSRIVPSGSMTTLDRLQEMSDTYDLMKSRYERHMIWLAEQAGAYRADIIQLRKAR